MRKLFTAGLRASRVNSPYRGIFHSVKGGSLWTAGVYEVLSLSWRHHHDTHAHTLYNLSLSTKALFVNLATKNHQ